jgi:hypothetical protein
MTLMDLPDKKRPVPGVRALQTWVRDAHRVTGVAAERISWLVASTVVVAGPHPRAGESLPSEVSGARPRPLDKPPLISLGPGGPQPRRASRAGSRD